ncbi:hypothetical protein TRAPUB_8399, partial [Trametes pubescens]
AADALHRAFLVNHVLQAESRLAREFFLQNPELRDPDWEDIDELEMDDGTSSTESSGTSTSSSSSSSFSTSTDSISSMDTTAGEPLPSEILTEEILELYSRHYWEEHGKILKTNAILNLLLNDWKHAHPEIFRSYLRITPDCFDALVEAIKDDLVFRNNSNNRQTPVAVQAAVALYRFGHHGNAASTMKVALLFGVSYGFVQLATARVIKACCSERFRFASVQWSGPAAKAAAMEAVGHICPGWRNGWCMVDGTLVPLFQRPSLFGNTWLDRKSNYSMNVQCRPPRQHT